MSGFSWNILTKAITWDELIGVESRSWMQSYTGRHIEAHGRQGEDIWSGHSQRDDRGA